MSPKIHAHRVRRMVEFAETDMAGIAHFSNFYRWMEAAEHALFRAAGLSVHRTSAELDSGFARVDARCSFRSPLRYQEWFELEVLVAKMGRSSMRYAFVFRRCDGEHGRAAEPPIALGSITAVHIPKKPGSTEMRSSPIPEDIREHLEEAPPEKLAQLEVENS
ncbi:MAG: acyl-CoA thioesterase [Planctomycetes bacterium]|nr:acyl-CoA thioesterase [Planctomycetota bacterium]